MSDNTIAVTGSTGRLGGLVARSLSTSGHPLRLLVRNPNRAPSIDNTTLVPADYSDFDAAAQALDGIDVVFMVSAHESQDRVDVHRRFIDAACAAGVSHIVYTSFLGAAPDAVFTLARDHWATEQHISSSGLTHTFLRNSFYLDLLPHMVGTDGVIRGPAGAGRLAGIAVSDIAEIASSILEEPTHHRGTTYELTGSEPLDFDQIASTLSRSSGHSSTFHNETIDEAWESRRSAFGAPDWQIDAWVSTYTAIASGAYGWVSPDTAKLLGREPMTLADVLGRLDGQQ